MGGFPSSPAALRKACGAQAPRRLARLAGWTRETVLWVPYVRFYPL